MAEYANHGKDTIMPRIASLLLILATTVVGILWSPTAARADSCWWHNGSLMRLQASGENRAFVYEVPRAGLAPAGVRRGTLLFNGTNRGGWYSGIARVFSSACPGNPLQYQVQGPVQNGQTRVVMQGQRRIFDNCRPTGRFTTDTLVFDYARQC